MTKKNTFFWNISLLYFTSGENRTMRTDKYQIEPTSKCGARSSCCSVFAERRVVSSSLPAFLKSLLLKGLYAIFVLAPTELLCNWSTSREKAENYVSAAFAVYHSHIQHILLPAAKSYPFKTKTLCRRTGT
jgi:hypothetical protein